jgi:hypothetical protein
LHLKIGLFSFSQAISQLSLFFIFAALRTLILGHRQRSEEGSASNALTPMAGQTVYPMMVGAALVTTTTVAVADATDDTFLGKMHTLGFTWPAGDDSDIVAMGHQICADRMAGKTPDAIAADIHSTLGAKGITFADVTSMVSAAESTYCPG